MTVSHILLTTVEPPGVRLCQPRHAWRYERTLQRVALIDWSETERPFDQPETVLHLSDGKTIHVLETPEQIPALIRGEIEQVSFEDIRGCMPADAERYPGDWR